MRHMLDLYQCHALISIGFLLTCTKTNMTRPSLRLSSCNTWARIWFVFQPSCASRQTHPISVKTGTFPSMGWEYCSRISLGRFRQASQIKLNSTQQMASLSLSLFLKGIYSNDKWIELAGKTTDGRTWQIDVTRWNHVCFNPQSVGTAATAFSCRFTGIKASETWLELCHEK